MRKGSLNSRRSEDTSKSTLWRLFTILVAVSVASILTVFGAFHYHIRYSVQDLPASTVSIVNQTVVKSGETNTAHTPAISPLLAYTIHSITHKHLNYDYNGTIYLTWHFKSSMFQYLNYKSLESMLLTYPNATFEIRLVAPEPAKYYKIGDILGKPMFMKYAKQGFKIYTLIQDGINDYKQAIKYPGHKYWQEEVNKRILPLHISQMRKFAPVPYHMSMYDTFIQLYTRGGVYTDFTYLHLHSILPEQGIGYMSRFSDDISGKRIVVSSIFVFLTTHHPTMFCMLKLYDNPLFLSCLQKDTVSDGVFCIEHGMSTCFEETQTENILSSYNFPSTIYINPSDNIVDVKNILKSSGVEISKFQILSLPLRIEGIVGPFSQHSQQALAQSAIIWLGHSACSQQWIIPNTGSLLRGLIEINDQRLSMEYQARLSQRYSFITTHNTNNTLQCSSYHSVPVESQSVQNRASLSCSMYFVIPGFMKAGTTYLYETIANHPLVVRNLRGVGFKETGCYDPPMLMPPGIGINSFLESVGNRSKSAVNSNSNSVSSSSLSSSSNSNKYVQHYHRRMDCFPFIEAHDQVQYGDGTVFYAARLGTPNFLMLDNPQLKVIFAVRRPVERLESHHRFDYRAFDASGIGDVNYCIDLILGNDDLPPQYLDQTSNKLVILYHLAKQALVTTDDTIKKTRLLQEIVTLFQSKIMHPAKGSSNSKHFYRCAKLFFDSFYLPSILHWLKVVPRSNILVVDVEQLAAFGKTTQQKLDALLRPPAIEINDLTDLVGARKGMKMTHDERRQLEKLKTSKEKLLDRKFLLYQFNAIFKFLGLPQLKRFTVSGRHDSELMVPKEHQMTEKTRKKLEEYFRPFMMLIGEVLINHSK